MEKPKHHIFVCSSFRASGEPQGVCFKKGAGDFLPYIMNELADRGMNDVMISSTGCLKVCDRGPAMVIYPANHWYGNIDNTDAIDEILDALEKNQASEKYLLS